MSNKHTNGLFEQGRLKGIVESNKRIKELEDAARAYQFLATSYRLGIRPTEKLFERLDAANKALSDGVSDDNT